MSQDEPKSLPSLLKNQELNQTDQTETENLELIWQDVCASDEVEEDSLYSFELLLNGSLHPVLIFRHEGRLHALHDECPHRRLPISSTGYIQDQAVYCGEHHWGFNIEDGAHLVPTGICVSVYPIREENQRIQVALT